MKPKQLAAIIEAVTDAIEQQRESPTGCGCDEPLTYAGVELDCPVHVLMPEIEVIRVAYEQSQSSGKGWCDLYQQEVRSNDALVAENDGLKQEVERLKSTCSCAPTYASYEGPEVDCQVHGVVGALYKAENEIGQLKDRLGEFSSALFVADEKIAQLERERDEHAEAGSKACEKVFSLQYERNELIAYRNEAINLRAAITDALGLDPDEDLDIIGGAIYAAKAILVQKETGDWSNVSPELFAQILAHYAAYSIFGDNRAESAALIQPIAEKTVASLTSSGYRLVSDEVVF